MGEAMLISILGGHHILATNGGGAIVNVLSSGGLVAVPAMGGYSPSKFAGRKERPEDIAAAGLAAIRRGVDELDTDIMAIKVRASLARDPKALERGMAKMLAATTISTGR